MIDILGLFTRTDIYVLSYENHRESLYRPSGSVVSVFLQDVHGATVDAALHMRLFRS